MKIAIVAASGIGDALIFHAVTHALTKQGWDATTISPHLASFGSWLPSGKIASALDGQYDACFLQHDNRQRSFNIPTYVFYGAYLPSKHGAWREEFHYVCDRSKTMVENVDAACTKFFGVSTKDYHLIPPKGLIHRRYKRRIAIHPTASTDGKMWPKDKFLKVFVRLKGMGYDPIFTASPKEARDWGGPQFPTLGDLSSFIYESGAFLGNDSALGHLASLLQIPHLIIAGDGLQMPLWRTGWRLGQIVTAPSWLMRFKAFRKRWKSFISVKRVIKILKDSVLRN